MSSTCRVFGVIGVVGLAGALAVVDAQAQVKVQVLPAAVPVQVAQLRAVKIRPGIGAVPEQDPMVNADAAAISFPKDTRAKKKLEAAADFIKESAWADATHVLQSLLNQPEDVFVEVERVSDDGKTRTTFYTSIRNEANRLLGTMPAQGLEVYELQFGAKAKDRLDEARKSGDPAIYADVAQRYLHTKAGSEATGLLGTYYLGRGQPVMAVNCFERLLGKESFKPTPLFLVKVALAYHRCGEKGKAEKMVERLAKLSPAGVRIGDQQIAIDDLQKDLNNVSTTGLVFSRFDHPMFKGGPSRSVLSYGDKPFLDEDTKKWVQPMIRQEQTKAWVDQAVKLQEERQRTAVLPAFFPIAATTTNDKDEKLPLVVFRSYFGVHAVNANNGKLVWEQDSDYSVDNLVNPQRSGGKLVQLNQWVPMYQGGGHLSLIYENSTLGTLSTDNNLVYFIDDLALPPHPQFLQNFMWGGQPNYGALADAVTHNRLLAVGLKSGKRVWQAGGRGEKAGELADAFFLGVPLPLGGKLYTLVEVSSELKLVCLNAADGRVSWTQKLASVRDPLTRDVGRRVQSVNLGFGDGILVCPTNSGAILGVDLLTHSLIWAHPYHKTQAAAPPRNPRNWAMQPFVGSNLTPDWKASAPIVQDGRVVFTAPDGDTIRCLNLRDGSLVWEQGRKGDMYLGGVYGGKVILVGQNNCRALSLASGQQLWNLDTGMPSGQGVAADKVYYLPLRSAVNDKESHPEVCAIDMEAGQIIAHTKSRKREIPGNLIFYEGKVISQTVREVSAYPQLKVKLAEMNDLIAKNPKDPVGLVERAELRRSDGELSGAVDDLRVALANSPSDAVKPKARQLLFESLTELFQRDFSANEKYLDEYREMCEVKVPDGAKPDERKTLEDEQRRRRGNYLCLVAKGREKQENYLEAFKHYEQFGQMGESAGLLTVIDEPTVKARADVWAQGRIRAMIAKATPEKRKPLEAEIDRRWQAVKKANDVNELRNFVAVFGSLFTVGKEARLELAERLVDQNSFLEAELQLQQLRRTEDPQIAARAVEMLARLMARKGLMEDAAYWYRRLGHDYDKVTIRDGKTGGDFLNDLATDKRFLPFLDEPASWTGKLKYREEFGQFNQLQQVYFFEPEGEVLPFFQRNRLCYQMNTAQLKLIDRTTGEERWSQGLTRQNQQHLQYLNWNQYNPQAQPVRFPYYVQGHTAVFSLGLMVYGLDLADKKILWERSLMGDDTFPITQIIPNPQGGLNAMYPDNRTERIGQAGPFEPGYVCLATRQGLICLDPVKGTVLWQKSDISASTQVFGDDQNLYMIEVRNDGGIGGGKAVRAHDGVAVNIPDFSGLYSNKVSSRGRTMIVKETDAKGNLTIRNYDVLTGKDLWKKEFTGNPVLLQSEEPNLLGVVEPGNAGKLTIFDTITQKDVLTANVDPKTVDKARGAALMMDRDHFYVAINGPQNAQVNPWGGPWPNLVNGSRGINVSGRFFAFDRKFDRTTKKTPTNKPKDWHIDLEDQVFVLDQFKDLPILLFTSRSQQLVNGGVYQIVKTTSVEKRTGKVIYDKKMQNNNTNYHTLNINAKNGTIDLIGYNIKIQHFLER